MADATTRGYAGCGAYDAVVVGSGPNGLAAAVTLAREGLGVLVVEAAPTIGGGMRSTAATLDGFTHDVCSAIHPLGVGSPFFRSLSLAEHGLEWLHPPAPLAHPMDDGTAAVLERSIEATGATLGDDSTPYRRLMGPLSARAEALFSDLLGPPLRRPRHPFVVARFGLRAIRSARGLAESWFAGEHAKGLFAGLAAHSFLPLDRPPTAAVGLMLGIAGHAVGWPMPRGGSQKIADALASLLRSLGGEIATGWRVSSLDELPASRAVLLDLTPRQVLHIAGHRLPTGYARKLERYRYGPGAYKLDWALDGPIPWASASCARAGTVHLGGTFAEIAASERAIWQGEHAERPFVLLAQQSLFDPSRAPEGKHTGWAYCHVPGGSTYDMTDRIEAQVERFAPGFRDRILARTVTTPSAFERLNENYVGGDIGGGVQDFRQLLARPVFSAVPYATPVAGLFLCSSSTPPGPGVHGMCGYHAAVATLRRVFSRRGPGAAAHGWAS